MFGGFKKDKNFFGAMRKQIIYKGEKVIRGIKDRKGSAIYAFDCLKIAKVLIEKRLTEPFISLILDLQPFSRCRKLLLFIMV